MNFDDTYSLKGLPWWLSGKYSAGNAGAAGDAGSMSGSGRSPGGGHSNPRQCSCLENPMDRAAWPATALRVAKSRIQVKPLSMLVHTHTHTHTHTQPEEVGVFKSSKLHFTGGSHSWFQPQGHLEVRPVGSILSGCFFQ